MKIYKGQNSNKDMKKVFSIFVLSLIISSFFISFASAQNAGDKLASGISSFIEGVIKALEPLFKIILGENAAIEFASSILILLIVFCFVYIVLNNIDFFNNTPWVLWTVTIAVSVLSVRTIGSAEIIQAIILPYTTLGVVVSAAVPFALFGYFVFNNVQSKTLRRILWIFFAIVFITLWAERAGDFTSDKGFDASNIYLYTAIASFIMIIFDGTFRKWLDSITEDKANNQGKSHNLIAIRTERNYLDAGYLGNPPSMDHKMYKDAVKKLREKAKHLGLPKSAAGEAVK